MRKTELDHSQEMHDLRTPTKCLCNSTATLATLHDVPGDLSEMKKLSLVHHKRQMKHQSQMESQIMDLSHESHAILDLSRDGLAVAQKCSTKLSRSIATVMSIATDLRRVYLIVQKLLKNAASQIASTA